MQSAVRAVQMMQAAEVSLPRKLVISRRAKVEANWGVILKVQTVRRNLLMLVDRRRRLAKENGVSTFRASESSSLSAEMSQGWMARDKAALPMHGDGFLPSHLHPNGSVLPFDADVPDMPQTRMPQFQTHPSVSSFDPVDGKDLNMLVPGSVSTEQERHRTDSRLTEVE